MSMTKPFYLLAGLTFLAGMSVAGAGVQNGQSKTDVIQALGDPDGAVQMNGHEYLSYGEFLVEFSNETVVNLPAGFNESLASSRLQKDERDRFISEQKSKGLVFYDGKWITNEQKDRLVLLAAQQEQMKREKQKALDRLKEQNKYGPSSEFIVQRKDGTKVDHRSLAIPGKVAFVLITTNHEFCPIVWKELKAFIDSDPLIELRRVDISSWDDPLSEQLAIYQTPRVRMVDPEGRVLNGPGYSFNVEKLGEAVAQAKRQCGL